MPPYMPLTLDPTMQVNQIPGKPAQPGQAGQQGGFDPNAFMMGALQNPEAGLSDVALKAMLSKGDVTKPELVTVYENGQPVQKWVRPGEATGVQIGLGKPDSSGKLGTIDYPNKDGSWQIYQERPDGTPDFTKPIGYPFRKRATASETNVGGPNLIQEKAESKTVGEGSGKTYNEIQDAGFRANSKIAKYSRLSGLLEGVQTGKFTPMGTDLAAWAQSAGFTIDPKLGNKQAAESLANEMALELRNPSGGAGMPGAMSDQDRNFLLKMVPSLATSPEGRKMMLETSTKIAQRDKEVARMAREYRKKHGNFDANFYDELEQFANANPLFPQETQGKTPGFNENLLNKYR